VDVVIGTSQILRDHSHHKSMAQITETAIEVVQYIKRYVIIVGREADAWLRSICRITLPPAHEVTVEQAWS
jgi:homocitrate synthase